jgi:hypothetical protein
MEPLNLLEQISIKGQDAANAFRLGYEGTANSLYSSFIDLMTTYTTDTQFEANNDYINLINVMLAAQERSDTLFLADILQYELLPMLLASPKSNNKKSANVPSSEDISGSNMKPQAPMNIEPFVTNDFNENYLYSVNRNSFIKRSSTDVFSNFFNKNILRESMFYIISGCDSGLLIKYIIEKGLPDNCCYLFIELDKHIEAYTKLFPELENNSQIKLVPISHWKQTAIDMEIDAYVYQKKVIFLKSIGATDLFDADYHSTNLTIESELQEHIFRVNASLGNHEFLEQQLMNISENIHPSQQLKNTLSGKTCIVLAGGPSLDNTLEWVIDNRSSLIVIAVSRISKRLLSAKITPDIVVSVDPKYNSFEVSRELLLLPTSVLFVHTNNVQHRLISQWQGKSVFLGSLLPWESKLNQENFNGEGPTVTNTAICLAWFMGMKTILLSGVDLCNSQQGISHASGSIEAEVGANLAFIGVNTTTYAGDPAQTTIQMAIAAKMLDVQAQIMKRDNVEISNLSLNATASEYIKYQSMSDIQLQPHCCSLSFVSDLIIKTDIKQRKKHNQALLKDLQKVILDCKEINKLATNALKHNKSLFDKNLSNEQSYAHKLKMDTIEKKLNTKLSIASNFIKEYGIQFFVKCVQPKNSSEWADDKLEYIGALYYKAYIKSTDLVLEKLFITKNRLLSRIDELSKNAILPKIIKHWEQDNQEGRCHLFSHYQQELLTELSAGDNTLLSHEAKKFQGVLTAVPTYKGYLKRNPPLHGVKTKIHLLFNQQDTINLNKLVQGLFVFAEKDASGASLYYLAQAYLLCLTEQYEQSLLSFEDVDKEDLEEDEFKQIARIALKLQLPELAESALSMLVNFNNSYLPQYANILRVNGKNNLAIDTYIEYLTTFDQDTYNWLELGKLFIKINANESAEMAFKRVLSLDANNKTANEQLQMLSK